MAYAKPSELAQALHKPRLDTDEQHLAESCLQAATAEIDAWIDWGPGESVEAEAFWARVRSGSRALRGLRPRSGEPDPESWTPNERELVRRVCVNRAVEWWKAADAAFGISGYADIGALRTPREGFLRHGLTLVAQKRRWGVA